MEGTSLPLLAGMIPKSLPLNGEVTVSGGNTKEQTIILLKLTRALKILDSIGLWGCLTVVSYLTVPDCTQRRVLATYMHLLQDVF